jgi:hypothetical protein
MQAHSPASPVLKCPQDVAVAADGSFICVTDAVLHKVLVYSPSGLFLRCIGDGKGSKAGRFDHPWGVAVDDSCTYVFVSDRYNHRIQASVPMMTMIIVIRYCRCCRCLHDTHDGAM